MARPIYLVNDAMTQIPGSRTLWHLLADWLGATFVPWGEADSLDGVVIRNATYHGPLTTTGPTVALLQDIMPPETPIRAQQVEVCQRADVIVANSAWTLSQYPELTGLNTRIIPLPVDTDLFRPREDRAALQAKWGIAAGSVCWVGGATVIKGFDRLHRLAGTSDLHFAVALKDAGKVHSPGWFGRMKVYARLTQAELAEVMTACRVGLCTSRIETQHLAGLEMAACGLPVVYVDPVGVYAEAPVWAVQAEEGKLAEAIRVAQAQAKPAEIREALLAGPWGMEACREAWASVVGDVS